jgi:hypothetical protein
MKHVSRRFASKAAMTALVTALLVGGSTLATGMLAVFDATPAAALTVPPWEPDPDSVGGLLFFNASGQQITGGTNSDSPLAAYVEGTSTVRAGDTVATLYGYLPISGESTSEWSGESLSDSTTYPNTGAPAPLNTATLPVVTGNAGDTSISSLESTYPNLDTSGDGYAGMYQLRLYTNATHKTQTSTYDSADILVGSSTWSVVYPATSTTTLTASPVSSEPFGTNETLTATITPSSATGTVQFETGSTPIGTPVTVSSGSAQTSTDTLPVGSQTLSAVFTPTAGSGINPSTGTLTFDVTAITTGTTLTASPVSPEPFGTDETLTATISPSAATGTVQFETGSTPIGSPVTVTSGSAHTSTDTLPVGSQTLSAVFTSTAGNGYSGSTGTSNFVVGAPVATTTTATASPSPTSFGTNEILTATISPSTAAGTVQFENGSTPIGSPVTVVSGSAQTSTAALPVGSLTINAVYTPAAGYIGSTGTTTLTVSPAASTTAASVSASSTTYGTSITYSATVTGPGTPTGTVTFSAGSTTLCTTPALVSGAGSCAAANAPAGTDAIAATYSGDTDHSGSTGTTQLVVNVTAPAPPAGATQSSSGTSNTSGGTAQASSGNVSASGSGPGALTVASYSANPTTGSVSGGTGVYYDVALGTGSGFSSLTITICNQGTGRSLQWWNGSSWAEFSEQSTVNGCLTATVTSTTSPTESQLTGTPVGISTNLPTSPGYWEVASDGGVFSFGGANYYGSTAGIHLNKPIVGMAPTPDHGGYWLVAADGGVFSFGDAQFYGSTGALTLNKPIVGMVATPSGKGYWLIASDGGVFSFGDAQYYGSLGGQTLNKPIVGMVATPSGNGYWLVASDGGVFNFGAAQFYGSLGGQILNKPIVGMAPTLNGLGYWLVGADGGVFSFGDANYYGSTASLTLNKPIVAITPSPDGEGYWLFGSDGGVFSFGDAGYYGSTASLTLNQPIVGSGGA